MLEKLGPPLGTDLKQDILKCDELFRGRVQISREGANGTKYSECFLLAWGLDCLIAVSRWEIPSYIPSASQYFKLEKCSPKFRCGL
ncbi:hypothetical protein CEXT_619891 [Caerostris extrusa]|uniref:Uncharacterized protein n=1 Tax=Caerostris extrusa TaxID=172846 RepID=A0AAV4R1L7_CAEEX|nr:hypothetical protein CEXT_619891 [Caerostris extrusa]